MGRTCEQGGIREPYLETLSQAQREYARSYLKHLRSGSAQPSLDESLTSSEAQQIRLKLAMRGPGGKKNWDRVWRS
jgi:hypothetical protein